MPSQFDAVGSCHEQPSGIGRLRARLAAAFHPNLPPEFDPIADTSFDCQRRVMAETFTAIETRRELLLWLSGAMTDDEEMTGLWAFLRDDFAYDPAYRAVIGPVLREREFDAWRDLMLEVQQSTATSRNYDAQKVRKLAHTLMAEMQAR